MKRTIFTARKYNESKLLYFIEFSLEGNLYQSLVKKYDLKLSSKPFWNYVKRYQLHGIVGLKSHKNNCRYSKKFKRNIISEHLNTGHGPSYLTNEYNIPAEKTITNWVKRYIDGKEVERKSLILGVYQMTGVKKSRNKKLKL